MPNETDVMPVFAIKASDNLAEAAIAAYHSFCCQRGLDDQAAEVRKALDEVQGWRARNPDRLANPDHKHAPAGSPGSGSEATP